MDSRPWEVSQDLSPDRLQLLATHAMAARHEVIDLRVEGRDDAWCLFCRAYSWTCAVFTELAKNGEHPWLKTRKTGLSFTFQIGNVPVKFYRGKAAEPKSNTLSSGVRMMLQQQRLDFFADEIDRETVGWFWLLAIETDGSGRVLEVIALQANAGGEIRHPWSIPLDGNAVAVTDVTDVRPEGVDLPEPEIGLDGDESQEANDGADGDDE